MVRAQPRLLLSTAIEKLRAYSKIYGFECTQLLLAIISAACSVPRQTLLSEPTLIQRPEASHT